MITIFTPSFADAANTNAQNLTAREIVVRLPPDRFRVQMLYLEGPDDRIVARPNTELIRWQGRGNTLRLLGRFLVKRPDIYFFPRDGMLDSTFLHLRRYLQLRTALVTYVVSTHDRGDANPILTRAIREADTVVGNSSHVAETVRLRFGVAATTIHTGIRREIFSPPARIRSGGAPLSVLYAGSFQKYKRVHLVVEEASRRPDVRFRIAGRGVEEHACRTLAQHLGCSNVEFLGHLSQVDLGEEMRHADVFFFPSELEGHPQVLGQAAACGLPCVALDRYHPDYVANGKTGFLVNSDAELSEKLGILLVEPDLRASFSAAAVELSARFDWDRAAHLWSDVMERAVTQRRGSRSGGAH